MKATKLPLFFARCRWRRRDAKFKCQNKFKILIGVTVVLGADWVGGCSSTVSLSEAKKVVATFEGNSFFPPPKSIVDIETLLASRLTANPEAIKRDVKLADADPPANMSGRERSDYYFIRSQAAARLGRADQELADLKSAASLDGNEIRSIREDLAHALVENGYYRDAISNFVSVRNDWDQGKGFRFRTTAILAGLYARAGDLEKAQAFRETAINFYAPLIGLKAQIDFDDLWSAGRHGMEALIARETGRISDGVFHAKLAVQSAKRALKSGYPTSATGSTGERPGSFRLKRKVQNAIDLLVDLLVRAEELTEAENVIRAAIRNSVADTGPNSILTTNHLVMFASVLVAQGRFDEAEKIATEVIRIFEQSGFSDRSPGKLHAFFIRARSHAARRNWQESVAEFTKIEKIIRQERSVFASVLNRSPAHALALSYTKDHAAATQHAVDSVAFNNATAGRKFVTTALAEGALAVTLKRAGFEWEAIGAFDRALPILLQRSRPSVVQGSSYAEIDQWKRIILENYIDQLATLSATRDATDLREAAVPRAFRMAQLATSGVVQRALSASAVRAAAKNTELANLVRQHQDTIRRIENLNGLRLSLLNAPENQQDEKTLSSLQANIARLGTARAAFVSEIEKRFPEYADLTNPQPVTIARVQSVLHAGEALIATHITDEKTFIWAVPKRGKVAFAVRPFGERAIGNMVRDLREALDPNVKRLGDVPDFDVRLAHRLFQLILEPVMEGWRDAKSLLVVPHKALGQLPFSILVTRNVKLPREAGPLFSNYRAIPWLVRNHAITVLPSVSSLIALRGLPARPPARRSFVGFGDPWFSEKQAQIATEQAAAQRMAGMTDHGVLEVRGFPLHLRAAPKLEQVTSADLSRLPRLPDTANEVKAIAFAMNADLTRDVFTGRDASEGRVKSMNLSGYRVLVFATHGLVAGDLNGLRQPALALTAPDVAGDTNNDGLLTMGEILGLRLDADWVVLSACNTAAGNGAGAQTMSGLGRAFFYAGTRAVLVSNWPVETTSARTLTTDLFRRQARNATLGRAEALRQAALRLINKGGYRDGRGRLIFSYAHPIFWAPFSLVGDGGGSGANGVEPTL